MLEWLNNIILTLAVAVEHNASVLLAAFVGATVSVVAREEKSVVGAIASFLSGVFAGWYLSQIVVTYVPLPIEPLAAVLAIMGRDLVRHIIKLGRDNPLAILDYLRGKQPTTKATKKTTSEEK